MVIWPRQHGGFGFDLHRGCADVMDDAGRFSRNEGDTTRPELDLFQGSMRHPQDVRFDLVPECAPRTAAEDLDLSRLPVWEELPHPVKRPDELVGDGLQDRQIEMLGLSTPGEPHPAAPRGRTRGMPAAAQVGHEEQRAWGTAFGESGGTLIPQHPQVRTGLSARRELLSKPADRLAAEEAVREIPILAQGRRHAVQDPGIGIWQETIGVGSEDGRGAAEIEEQATGDGSRSEQAGHAIPRAGNDRQLGREAEGGASLRPEHPDHGAW